MHTAQSLSRGFHAAYREIDDLVLSRSQRWRKRSNRVSIPLMTHEEMAQRIGASRETVTRLLSDLKRKQLIRQDGPHAGH